VSTDLAVIQQITGEIEKCIANLEQLGCTQLAQDLRSAANSVKK